LKKGGIFNSYINADNHRQSFIGKPTSGVEKDNESSLGDFGVRKFDDFTGRFFQIDPLWEKYYSWTPYHYSANNPVSFLDPGGKDAYVTIQGSTITISTTIFIYGSGATQSTANMMQSHILAAWGCNSNGDPWTYTDPKTKQTYNVVFDVSVKLYNPNNASDRPGLFSGRYNPLNRDNYIEVDKNYKNNSYVKSGDEGLWRGGGWLGFSFEESDPAPHEFGHLIGFMDRSDKVFGVEVGWEGNIMAEPAMQGSVWQANINMLVTPIIKEYNQYIVGRHVPHSTFYTTINYNIMQY
jgi:RHS repeat-associated protein